MKQIIFFSVFLFFFIVSCNNNEDDTTVLPPNNEFEQFIGNYQIASEHISGLHPVFDSVGNVLGLTEDTTLVIDSLLTILEKDATLDTVIINGLIKSAIGNFRQEVLATFEQDSLIIHYDQSNQISNDYVRGKIWLEGDSLFLDYRWDRSDTWSTGATPVYGNVKGKGIRQ